MCTNNRLACMFVCWNHASQQSSKSLYCSTYVHTVSLLTACLLFPSLLIDLSLAEAILYSHIFFTIADSLNLLSILAESSVDHTNVHRKGILHSMDKLLNNTDTSKSKKGCFSTYYSVSIISQLVVICNRWAFVK